MSAMLPPGTTLIATIAPSLNLLIIGTVWGSMLVPLLFTLILFSTPQVRRQPIFLLNLFAVVAGIAVAALNLQLYVLDILSAPGEGFRPRSLLAYLGMILYLPLYIDCILAYRLYIVYPPRSTPARLVAFVFVPVVLFKIARITNLAMFFTKFSADIMVPDATTAISSFEGLWEHAPYAKIEWLLQARTLLTIKLLTNLSWASALFLWKLGTRTEVMSSHTTSSGGDRLKNLFYLALSTFVFPCMFSIAQIIIVFRDDDFFIGAYLFVTNLYIEIIGVLMATIWAAKGRTVATSGSQSSAGGSGTQVSSIAFRPGIAKNTMTSVTSHAGPGGIGGKGEFELEEVNAEEEHKTAGLANHFAV
uniref:G-protein coupled receptors family 1 profile domain-containing protein n=1 Tax=Mycena chlorophos TaxID=658473 RepID=A0ABQ0M158_MYCCL|nr:predicted protein [Mycena chlorophos]